jgi:hypothetical protein
MGDMTNDPMNPMGQVQTSSPMNPMGTASQQAYGLSSLGRGNDSMLVHMTPNEVQGLQSLAMAHGGSLTTNPDTGLPEAGFLDSILPAIVGIGAAVAAPFTAGTSLAALGPLLANPFVVGGLSGLGAMIANGGDWREGLKWGLGTASGTGLGRGLASMVKPVATVGEAGAATAGAGAAGTATQNAAQLAAQNDAVASMGGIPSEAGTGAATANTVPVVNGFATNAPAVGNYSTTLSNMSTGLKNALTSPTAYKAFDPGLGGLIGTGGRGMLGTAGLGLASMAMQQPEPLKIRKSQQDKDYGPGGKYEYKGPYTFPDYPVTYATPEEIDQGVEHSYFGDKYNLPPQYVEAKKKEGGVIGMADGGDVGEQSYFGNDYYNGAQGRTLDFANMPSWMATDPFLSNLYKNFQNYPWFNAMRSAQNTGYNTTPAYNSGAGYSDSGEQMFFSPSYFSAGQGAAAPATTTTPTVTGAHAAAGIGTPTTGGSFGFLNNAVANAGSPQAFKTSVMGPPKPKGMAVGGIAGLPGAPAGNGNVEGMLSGPGDGMSDSIPARIDGKQEARLATGEFVIPADVVSHLGNGASEPGAKVLYAMMDRVRKARTGNPEQGKEIKPDKFLPA